MKRAILDGWPAFLFPGLPRPATPDDDARSLCDIAGEASVAATALDKGAVYRGTAAPSRSLGSD
ncbi:hypothetical protein GCM10028775_55000 [Catellatospora paridis]